MKQLSNHLDAKEQKQVKEETLETNKMCSNLQAADTISCSSLLDGQHHVFEKGAVLGTGTFAVVYALNINGKETNWVCKEIALNHPKARRHCFLGNLNYKRNYRYFEAINEINGLYQQGLLVGYELKKDTFYIVTKKINGSLLSLAEKNVLKPGKLYYKAYQQLKKFHRKGYVHLDPHSGNFIVSPHKPHKVSLIDFSRSQTSSYFGRLIDYKLFFSDLPQNYSMVDFYIREKREYLQNHKITSILGLLSWPLFIMIAAKLVVPSMIHLENFLMYCFLYELLNMATAVRSTLFSLALTMVALPIILLGMALIWEEQALLLMKGEVSIFDPLVLLNTVYTVSMIVQLGKSFLMGLDDYVLPETVINKKMNFFFKHIHPLKQQINAKLTELSESEEKEFKCS